MKQLRILLVPVVLVALSGVASANLLLNESFETGTGQNGSLDAATIDNWSWWGGGWWANDAGTVYDGSWSIKRWDNGTGMYQDFTATAGVTYDFSAWGLDDSDEQLVDRWLNLNVEWYDSGDARIDDTFYTLDTMDDSVTLDTWTQLAGSMEAPANTAYGRIILATEGGGSAAGTLHYDSASVTAQVIPEPTVAALFGLGLLGLMRFRRMRRQ